MADTKKLPPAGGRPPAAEDQDILFRAQMAVYNFILGQYRVGLAIIGVGLAVALVYGLVSNHTRDQQRGWQAQIAAVDRKVPEPDQMAQLGLAPMDDLSDATRVAALTEAAQGYEKVGAASGGTASAMAWLRAADLWRRLHKADEASNAYEKAHAVGADGILGWATITGLAASKAEKGDVDGAAALYRDAANKGTDFYAQRALYELGLVYEAAGRKEDAQRAFEEFSTKYADSTFISDVAAAQGRLRGAG